MPGDCGREERFNREVTPPVRRAVEQFSSFNHGK